MTAPRARKLLHSGRLVDLERPKPTDIDLRDIAHSLAHMGGRFGGHGDLPATVAQHSVHVSLICPPDRARWGLLHDAAECYLRDMSTELKRLFPYYKELENRWEMAIAFRFGVPPCDVKYWDTVSLLTERRDNGPHGINDQELLGPNRDVRDYAAAVAAEPTYRIWTPEHAEQIFLARAKELGIE